MQKENNSILTALFSVVLTIAAVATIFLAITVYRFPMPEKVILCGLKVDPACATLDLSGVQVHNLEEVISQLPKLENLKTVKFGDQLLLNTDKDRLKKKFPNVDFQVSVYYQIYGQNVPETETKLDLSQAEIDEDLPDYLKKLPALTEVNLYEHTFAKDQQIKLQKQFPAVTFLWNVDILSQTVDCNTEELDFSKQTIPDLADFRKSLSLLPKLATLDMSNTNLTNEELGALREEFPGVQIDWVVHLGKWSMRTDAVAFSVLVYTYNYKRMTSEDIQVLKYCTKLQALDLGHQVIEDISVIGEYLPDLRVLILADNHIKDISCLSNLKHLHYIELFMNYITDVSALANCKELVDVNICFNPKFSNIEPLMDFPLLERLWLIADNISAKDYDRIRERYPDVKLVNTGSGSTKSGWRTHERYYKMIDMFHKNYIDEVFTKFDDAVPEN